MSGSFGKTWWGEHWLRSLDNIDYDNRLPRGASYARNGKVIRVKILENTITAKVSGSRPTPYKVTIIIPPFFEDKTDKLIEEIIRRPAMISRLLNRDLDPQLLKISEAIGLKVFPKQWTDFKMQCNCPDWAVPCKHLAAVIYIISREIDNNPFLVFEIHKVNLLEELHKRGIHITQTLKTEIPTLADIRRTKPIITESLHFDSTSFRPDFSKLENISEAIVRILPDSPPFYPKGNFTSVFMTQFYRISKEFQKVIKRKADFISLFSDIPPDYHLNKRAIPQLISNERNEIFVQGEHNNCQSLEQLMAALYTLPPEQLPDYEPAVISLRHLLFASLHLLAAGAFVPQIVQTEDKRYGIRWMPALIDTDIKSLMAKMELSTCPGIFQVQIRKKNSEFVQNADNQAIEIISLFLTSLIGHISKLNREDVFYSLFFSNCSYEFSGVGENALPGGIKVWLDRFFINTEAYKPMLIINETGDERFEIQLWIESKLTEDDLPISIYRVLNDPAYLEQRYRILQGLSLLSPFIQNLDKLINEAETSQLILSNREFASFLTNVLPVIRLLGLKIMLPRSMKDLIRPRPTVHLRKNNFDNQGFIRLEHLLNFDWKVAIGDEVMGVEEFQKLMKNASGLIRFKERYIYVSDADIEKIHKTINGNSTLNSFQLLQAALSETYQGSVVSMSPEVQSLIRQLTSDQSVRLPVSLRAELRPYQERGFSWMYKNSKIGFGCVLADDMGLGKTIQTITLLLKYQEEGVLDAKNPALVIAPAGLLINWQSEIERFAPTLTAMLYHGPVRQIKDFNHDILLTSYGTLRSDVEILKKKKWQAIIIDEAQNIKNNDTSQAKAVKSIPAVVRIAMSGTPVENRMSEFWSIMDFTNKGYLGNEKWFREVYAQPIQMDNDAGVALRFRKVTAPFLMRRMKTDKSIISDLPDKLEQNQYAVLSKQQAGLYEKTVEKAMEEIEGIIRNDHTSLFKRQGLVLQMILALKQICNHPANFLKKGNFEAEQSGKMVLLFELLENICQRGEKVLIFTQFKEMGDLLQQYISRQFNEAPLFYHGGCNLKKRNEMVERFQNHPGDKIFVLSLRAAGTGLNLTAASHVIHYDLWWNPAVEAQATDRAYRIGQTKNVMVHRIITKNTFEERIDAMIQKKKHLAEMTVASGENWIGKMSNKELRDIFG
ncbi:MAG: DEAD/DEAH box helicase [Bacteroidales bacterium]|nr:DEAD/DEAH box helicase [Bacteroidales bacterium]